MKKGNVLLLALFMVAFIVSIIGLMYSYNKRILILSQYEKDNYRKVNLSIRENILNIYMLEKFQNIDGIDIKLITLPPRYLGGFSTSRSFTWPSPEKSGLYIDRIDPDPDNGGFVINTDHGRFGLNLSNEMEPYYSRREQYARQIMNAVKQETRNFLDISFKNFTYHIIDENETLPNPPISGRTNRGTYVIKYIVEVENIKGKNKNKDFRKKFEVTFAYKLNVLFSTNSKTTRNWNYTDASYQDGLYSCSTTVNFQIDVSTNVSATLDSLSIKQIK